MSTAIWPASATSAPLGEIRKHGPWAHAGSASLAGRQVQEDDRAAFGKTMKRAAATLREQPEDAELDAAVAGTLKELAYG